MNIATLDSNMAAVGPGGEALEWRLPSDAPFRLAGLPWFARDGVYRRLSLNPQWPLRPEVDALADCPAGAQVQFQTDSPALVVRAELAGPADLVHMPATGQCGFDCYVGPPRQSVYWGTTKFKHGESAYESALFKNVEREMRNITLNFPLYRHVKRVEIGLAPGSLVLPPPPYDDARPIVVYGTSIDQGGCASRPGMAWTNILSRAMNRPFVNLGFSGNGRGEPELARFIGAIPDPALIVVKYEGNAYWDGILERTFAPFLAILRQAHAAVPILVVSRPPETKELYDATVRASHDVLREFQRRVIDRLRDGGDANVHFLDGSLLWGEDWRECTVDGLHPSDWGFQRMAENLRPVMERLLDPTA